jgi:hypothetical protein
LLALAADLCLVAYAVFMDQDWLEATWFQVTLFALFVSGAGLCAVGGTFLSVRRRLRSFRLSR